VFTDKKQLLAQRNGQPNVLVDDFKKYIQAWSEAGGIPILYRDANVDSVIAQLAEIYGVDQESQTVTEDTSSAEQFIHDVYAEYPQMWQNNHVMPFSEEEFAMFELKPSIRPNAVDVYWFQAWPQRQGIGSRAMKVLQDKAREYGVGLTLITWDKGRVSQAALTKFYKRQGFKQDVKGSRKMSWDPQSVKESKETRQTLLDQHFEFPQQGQYGYRTGYQGRGVLEVADGHTGKIINLGEFGTFDDEYKPNQKWLRIVFTNPNMDDNAWDELEDMLWSDNQVDEDFADGEENKSVTIHTNPNYRGATIGAGVKEQLPVTKMPIDELYMWENDKTLRIKAVRDWVKNTLIPKLQDKGRLMPMIVWNRKGKYFVIDGNHRFLAYKAAGFKGDVPVKVVPQEMIAINNKILEPVDENFADGKKPGRKGLAKRVGVDCKQPVTKLRSIAKNSTGERQRMAHWCANMKSGRKK
jgi:GNAT superfamily N-acetyltransferase